jgi:hypothetical protein
MGLHKDRHGTYYARRKVPKRLEEAVAKLLGNGKARQSWLKCSLGTKDLKRANVLVKPALITFDQTLARADERLADRPLRRSLSQTEINRIAEYHFATGRRRFSGRAGTALS